MGRHQDPNGKNHQSWLSSGPRQIRLGSLICLVALLAHFYLPLVHQYEHILEGFIASAAWGGEQQAEFQLGAPESQDPHQSHHDAATCPLCQEALSSRYFTVTTPSLSPSQAIPVQRFRETAFTEIVANPDILTSGPRAPPTSL
jgi:hypothetical protein